MPASLLFNYTANFLYQGDAPLAERRAAALALDHAQLRELLGAADYRELLDADAIDALALELQRLDERRSRRARRRPRPAAAPGRSERGGARRAMLRPTAGVSGELGQLDRGAARDAADRAGAHRRRAAVGRRRGRGPTPRRARRRPAAGTARSVSRTGRRSAGRPRVALRPHARPVSRGRRGGAVRPGRGGGAAGAGAAGRARTACVSGEFLPGGSGREWCDAAVLRRIKSRSLALLRKQIEPAPPEALARFLPVWQGVERPRRGLDGLLDAIEQLQGAPLLASDLDELILPARVADYQPSDLDELCAAGEVVWRGVESVGPTDGRVALVPGRQRAAAGAAAGGRRRSARRAQFASLLAARGAVFFDDIARELGGFRNDVLDALWQLVWAGHVTNDTLAPLRARAARRRQPANGGAGRAAARPAAVSLAAAGPAAGRRRAVVAHRLRRRGGALAHRSGRRRSPSSSSAATACWCARRSSRELVEGGFAALYPVLRAMEEAGRVRRGYFVAGMGGAQFASPGADEAAAAGAAARRRGTRTVVVLAASDPANAYGAHPKWPHAGARACSRSAAAGRGCSCSTAELIGYLGRTGNHLLTFPPEDPADEPLWREKLAAALARRGAGGARRCWSGRSTAQPAGSSPLAHALAATWIRAHQPRLSAPRPRRLEACAAACLKATRSFARRRRCGRRWKAASSSGADSRSAVRSESLHGRTVTAVEARGKHLLMHLRSPEGGPTYYLSPAEGPIHSHLGMTGSWHIYRPRRAVAKADALCGAGAGDQPSST